MTLGASNVNVGGEPVALKGSPLTAHGPVPGHGELMPAFMYAGSTTVKANGKGVVRAGDVSTCLESATGHSKVTAGG